MKTLLFYTLKLNLALLFICLNTSAQQIKVSNFHVKEVEFKKIERLANFNAPFGVVADTMGNLFVADMVNHIIRKINKEGVVSTFAGSFFSGNKDGVGTMAQLNQPCGITKDAFGNFFVADFGNHKIRKITPNGEVSTFAGNGFAGNVDGASTTASFNHPTGVAVDKLGNVYVVDQGNNCIRKITSTGVVRTFAGSSIAGFKDGNGIQAAFDHPQGIAMDTYNNLFIADMGNHTIRKITPAAEVSTLKIKEVKENTTWHNAYFKKPVDVKVDDLKNIYVADQMNAKIQRITADGIVSGIVCFSEKDKKYPLYGPSGLTLDKNHILYVSDAAINTFFKIYLDSQATTDFISSIQVFSNKTKDGLLLDVSVYETLTTTIKIMNAKGRVVKQVIANVVEGKQNIEIGFADIPAGAYSVQVYHDDEMVCIFSAEKK